MQVRIVKVVLMLTPIILRSDEEMFPHYDSVGFVKQTINATKTVLN